MLAELIGQKLGSYQITALIGEGGMAVVFKAHQASLERDVAIKVLPPAYAHDPEFLKRFQREAKSIARLNHPHILPVYDFGVDRDYSYIVMRYVEDGQTLTRLMRQSLSQKRAVELISQVGRALAYANQRGVIHRDLKPSNVLIDEGWPLLSDFGLAKVSDGSTDLTNANRFLGTPRYMAPEQFEGQAGDQRTDTYALGLILYQMLTQTIPHEADTPLAMMLKRKTEPPPAPRSLNPAISPGVEQVMLRALAIEPKDRYDSASEFVTALQQASGEANREPSLDDESTVASVRSLSRQLLSDSTISLATILFPGKKSKLNRLRLFIGAVIGIIIIAGGLWGWNIFNHGNLPEPTPTQAGPKVAGSLTLMDTPTSAPTWTPMNTPVPTVTPSPTPRPTDTPTLRAEPQTPLPSPTPSATPTPAPPTDTPAPPVATPTSIPAVKSTSTPVPPTLMPASVDVPAAKLVEYNGEIFLWEWKSQTIPGDVDWYFDIKIYDSANALVPYDTLVANPDETPYFNGQWHSNLKTNFRSCSYWAVQIAKRNPDGAYAGPLSPESDRLSFGVGCGGSGGSSGGGSGNSSGGPPGGIN